MAQDFGFSCVSTIPEMEQSNWYSKQRFLLLKFSEDFFFFHLIKAEE